MRSPALVSGRWPALGATVIALAVPLSVLIAPHRFGELGATAIWGLVIVLSFFGWGSFTARRLVPELAVDWGLRAAWGLALTLAIGGLLCFFGIARRPVLLAWIFGGILLAARETFVPGWPHRKGARIWGELPGGWETFLVVGTLIVTAYLYRGAAARAVPNPSDDWPAYLPFIRRLLQAGTFIDPFSVRRMAAYGGQTYLQALALIVAGDGQIQIFDGGICLLLTVGLIFGFAREARQASWMVLLLVVLVVIMLPDDRVNSASEMSGVVGFVAAFRTLVLVERRGLRGFRAALLAALPIAAVSTLRQNYMVVAAAMVLALLLRREGRGDEQAETWQDRGRHFGWVALLVCACLLPWATLAFRSNHTFLFPIFHGNYSPTYPGITAPATWDARLRFYIGAVFHTEPIHTMPLLLLAGPAIASGANRRALLGLWGGTIVGFALLALSLPDAEIYSVARYELAYVVAFVIATGLAASEGTPEKVSPRGVTGFALAMAGLALQIYGSHGAAVHTLTVPLDRLKAMKTEPRLLEVSSEDERRMQLAVPRGERLLVMIERPYLLDFARNRVSLLDQPGAAGPDRGLPLAAGSEKVATYLVAHGVRYFAFARPDRARDDLYSRSHWRTELGSPTRIWRITAPLFLAAFDAVDQIAQSRRRLFDDGHLVVVDLTVVASASTPIWSPTASAPGG